MNHATPRARRIQQNSVLNHSQKSHYLDVFNLMTSDALFDRIESLLPEHRERLFPPTETLSMFVAQALNADRSCQNIVNQAAIQRLSGGLPTCSTHTGGYCRARRRLPLALISEMTRFLGSHINRNSPTEGSWYGRHVRIVDGTTVTMPDTPLNQAMYPQQGGQSVGLGFPICRVVGITCLLSGALLNAAIGRFKGKGGDEQTLLRTIQDTFQAGDIVLGDAYFATYFFIAEMQRRGIDILMEQNGMRKRSTDFRRGRRLGQRDHLIDLAKPKLKPQWMSTEQYQAAPESITVREFKASGKIMVTTMTHPKTESKIALKQLYKKRWSVELDIRDIKHTMGMGALSCKTPDMAIKEIWVYLLAYNLIRLVMLKSALLVGIMPRSISFKHCLQIWLLGANQIDLLDQAQQKNLLLMISQKRVDNRPGRIEPRAVKRRPKQHALLVVPRMQARKQITDRFAAIGA
ncbi:MAG: IS4 family transposase [Gammaproteobacteria bacterium]|nr:IS4 family transposase [Gammaproteobacteria bacterium]